MSPRPRVELATVIAHVGLCKTGTTALQTYFDNCGGELFYGEGAEPAELFDAIRHYRAILFSNESFSATPYEVSDVGYLDRFEQGIRAVSRLFHPDRFIIGFRRHTGFIQSCYRQYIHEGGTGTFDEFYRLGDSASILDLPDRVFSRCTAVLDQIAGPENVFVYIQEDLSRNFEQVRMGLESFIGQPLPTQLLRQRNYGVGVRSAAVLRQCNAFEQKLASLGLPRLRGGLLSALGISAPQVCRKWLRYIPQSRHFLSREDADAIDCHFQSDWESTLARRSYQPPMANAA